MKNYTTKTIFIVDDHALLRVGLKTIINDEKDLTVCGETTNANEAIKLIGQKKPTLVISDITLEGNVNGIELVRAIKQRYPSVLSLVLSVHDDYLYAERAIKAGAMGYINKNDVIKNIVEAIYTVLSGELYLNKHTRIYY